MLFEFSWAWLKNECECGTPINQLNMIISFFPGYILSHTHSLSPSLPLENRPTALCKSYKACLVEFFPIVGVICLELLLAPWLMRLEKWKLLSIGLEKDENVQGNRVGGERSAFFMIEVIRTWMMNFNSFLKTWKSIKLLWSYKNIKILFGDVQKLRHKTHFDSSPFIIFFNYLQRLCSFRQLRLAPLHHSPTH